MSRPEIRRSSRRMSLSRPSRPQPDPLSRSSPYQGLPVSSQMAAGNVGPFAYQEAVTPPPLRPSPTKAPSRRSSDLASSPFAENARPVSAAVTDRFADIPQSSGNYQRARVGSHASFAQRPRMTEQVIERDSQEISPRQRPERYSSQKRSDETRRLLPGSSPPAKTQIKILPRIISITSVHGKAVSRHSEDIEIGLHKSAVPWRRGTSLTSKAPSRAAPDPVGHDEYDEKSDVPHLPLQISVFRETLFVGAVVMAQFMALAGLGQAISPMNVIGNDLAVNKPGEQAWFSASYSLTVGTFILISGRMGDIIGHKRMFIFGYFFLGVWSGFAGFSVYLERQIYFDICRAFQGLGAALLAPNALALLGRAYPPGLEKNLVFSLFGAMAPWGFVVGALYGAVLAEYVWWPWIFWSYGIAAWTMAAFSTMVVPKELAYAAQFRSGRPRPGMDWSGCALGVTGLVLINVGWNNGPLLGWNQAKVYVILAVGVIAMLAFFYVEARAKSPILPIRAMNATVAFTLALVSLGWASFGVWIFYTWRFLEQLRGLQPVSIVAEFTPALVVGLLAAGATGAMLTNTPVSFTMMVSMCAFFVGGAIAAFQPVTQVYWAQMFVSIIIMPFGMDMSFPAATIILSNHMPREHQGLAASLVNTFVNYSISLGLGIAATVEAKYDQGGTTPVDVERGIRVAYYTGLAMAGCGVILGALFFARSMLKEGWKVMDH